MPDKSKNEAYQRVLDDEDIGFIEKLYGFKTRMSSEEFEEALAKDHYYFLQPHMIRVSVMGHLL